MDVTVLSFMREVCQSFTLSFPYLSRFCLDLQKYAQILDPNTHTHTHTDTHTHVGQSSRVEIPRAESVGSLELDFFFQIQCSEATVFPRLCFNVLTLTIKGIAVFSETVLCMLQK